LPNQILSERVNINIIFLLLSPNPDPMFEYFKKSFARKKARRVFQEYGFTVSTYNLAKDGQVAYANWDNPLMHQKGIVQEEIDFYAQSVYKGSLALDIGANVGDTTVPMAIAAGKDGLVLALEPNPVVYKILQANAFLNKDKSNIVTIPYAASDKEEEFFYMASEASFSNGGIKNGEDGRKLGKHVFKQKVQSINLEKYLNDNHADMLPKLSLIKVDTEGFDLKILKTLSSLIEKYHPNILAEVFVDISDNERLEMFDFLNGHGYRVLNIFHFSSYNMSDYEPILKREDMLKTKGNFNIWAIKA